MLLSKVTYKWGILNVNQEMEWKKKEFGYSPSSLIFKHSFPSDCSKEMIILGHCRQMHLLHCYVNLYCEDCMFFEKASRTPLNAFIMRCSLRMSFFQENQMHIDAYSYMWFTRHIPIFLNELAYERDTVSLYTHCVFPLLPSQLANTSICMH